MKKTTIMIQTMGNRIKAFAFLIACIFAILAAGTVTDVSFAASTQTSSDGQFDYVSLGGNEIGISRYNGTDSVLRIPDTIDGKRVVSILVSMTAEKSSSVEELILADSIEEISSTAFRGWKSLRKVHCGTGLKAIYSEAFRWCYALEEVEFSDGLEYIDNYAFAECTSLKEVRIPKSLIGFGNYYASGYSTNPFKGCTSLSKIEVDPANPNFVIQNEALIRKRDGKLSELIMLVPQAQATGAYTLPNGISRICADAFQGSGITSIYIPDSLNSIPPSAFSECTSLTEITGGKNVTIIDSFAFYNCTNLRKVALTGSFDTIGPSAFKGCSNLTDLTIPDTVAYIGEAAFSGCSSLSSFHMPENIQYIEKDAFSGCAYTPAIPSHMEQSSTGAWVTRLTFGVVGDEERAMMQECLQLVNEKRAAEGLSPLTMDQTLMEKAVQRAAETVVVFSHTRPNAQKWSSMNNDGIGPVIDAENIAAGNSSAESVLASWMDSAEHSGNILGDFSSTGIGCYTHGGICYWVQLFSKSSAYSTPTTTDYTDVLNTKRQIEILPYRSPVNPYLNEAQSTYGTPFFKGDQRHYLIFNDNAGWDRHGCAISNDSAEWSSSDEQIATVDQDGWITGLSEGTVTITARLGGKYPLKTEIEIIDASDVSESQVDIYPYSYRYQFGQSVKPSTINVYLGGRALTEGVDYKLSFRNTTHAGQAQIIITGQGNFTGTKTFPYTIAPMPISYAYIERYDDSPIVTVDGKKFRFRLRTGISGDDVLDSSDYDVYYNSSAGTLVFTGKNDYTGTAEWSIEEYKGIGSGSGTTATGKKANPLSVKPKTASLKYSKLKKKAQTLKRAKVLSVSKGKGTVTYKLKGVTKAKFRKYFRINSKTGKVTVRKGLKKGTYKIKVAVTASGNKYYKKKTRTVTFRVKVK